VDVSEEGVAEVGQGALAVLLAIMEGSEVDGEWWSMVERWEEDGGSRNGCARHHRQALELKIAAT
jgi:hypothetical protein